jgi:hypothetical protein
LNLTLALALVRQRLASPIRVAILGLMLTVPQLLLAVVPGVGLGALGDAYPIGILFAAGMIGQDVSSGVLQLVLARPVRRWEYVLSRWGGAAGAATVAALAQALLGGIVLALRGAPPDAQQLALFGAARALEIFGVVAVFALLSSLAGGLGDLGLYVVLTIGGGLLSLIGQLRQWPALQWAGQELGALLGPKLDLAAFVAGAPFWLPALTYASNLTLCLLLAVVVMNRKELSYASG